MIFCSMKFFSESLEMCTEAYVLLPQRGTAGRIGDTNGEVGQGKFKCLYLLHGLSDDQSIWMRRTSIERYAEQYGIAVVMPFGGRSFYTDMKFGMRYYTYIAKELPARIADTFNISTDRQDNFIAGLSMGGYGALRIALSAPERFGAAFAMSPLVDLARAITRGNSAITPEEMRNVFGPPDEQAERGNDLLALARKARTSDAPPRIAVHTGTEDLLYNDGVCLCGELEKLAWPDLEYSLDAPGKHDWSYWSAQIPAMLEFFRKP